MRKVVKIGAVIFFNCNPVYDYPAGDKLAAAIKKIGITISTNYKEDETGSLTNYSAPDHHFLESWNDAEPKKNHFSLAQPAITPIFRSRAAQESFLTWAGESNVDYFEFVKNNWRTGSSRHKLYLAISKASGIKCLYDGVYEPPVAIASSPLSFQRRCQCCGELHCEQLQGREMGIGRLRKWKHWQRLTG
jgi:molybdopterin-containing oxidoreductase family iron-sulfur binding subunit